MKSLQNFSSSQTIKGSYTTFTFSDVLSFFQYFYLLDIWEYMSSTIFILRKAT